jgi:hypothetical protein
MSYSDNICLNNWYGFGSNFIIAIRQIEPTLRESQGEFKTLTVRPRLSAITRCRARSARLVWGARQILMPIRFNVAVLAGSVLWTGPASAETNRATIDLASMARDDKVLAPGLTYTGYIGQSSGQRVFWSISFGVGRSAEERKQISKCAVGLKLSASNIDFKFPGPRPTAYNEQLFGRFDNHAAARSHLATIKAAEGCSPQVKASPQYPLDQTLPWRIHVLNLTAGFVGSLEAVRANGVATGRATASGLAKQLKAYAAVNGGFFVMESTEGIVGESTGISILAGELLSEPGRRPWALVRNGDHVRVDIERRDNSFRPEIIWSDKSKTVLDGINRDPLLLRNCGALNGKLSIIPWHDRTCVMDNQIVAISADAGFVVTPKAGYLSVKIGREGTMVAARPDDRLETGEYLVLASGKRRAELSIKLQQSLRASVRLMRWPIDKSSFAVNGGPVLLERGKFVKREDREGWPFRRADHFQATEMHRFVSLRAPRTALGVTTGGDILLVVVDGHRFRDDQPAKVAMNGGATLDELRSIMQTLGARDAINLDGGGSSVMVGPDGILSHPSDAAGERAVGDTLVIIPVDAR